MIQTYVIEIFLTFAATVVLIPLLARLAPYSGLVDKPDGRKQHAGDVPLVGGIAIFLALLVVNASGPAGWTAPPVLIGLGSLLVLVGIVDDLVDLQVWLRVLVQVTVASAMVFFMDVRIESIGALFGGETVLLGPIGSAVFTVLCVVGVINAINMIDGLDGLSGSILLVSFAVLAVLAFKAGAVEALFLCCVCAALVGFLAFNARFLRGRAVVFLGDSGSLFLGLVLVWAFVQLTQGETPVLTSVSAGWIFGLPLVETVALIVGRIVDGKSPFQAGRDHLHHKLLDAGFSVNKTLVTMIAFHALLAGTGFLFAHSASNDALLFWLFVAVTVMYFLVSRNGYDSWRASVRQIDGIK